MTDLAPRQLDIPAAIASVAAAKAVFDAAKPIIEARRMLRPLVERYGHCTELPIKEAQQHRDEALRRVYAIPDGDHELQKVGEMLNAAVNEPASEQFIRTAVGVMLEALPNAKNVPANYAFAMTQVALYDERHWDGYCTTFSPAVVTLGMLSAIGVAKFVPMPAEFLELCAKQRQKLAAWSASVDHLQRLRWNAEEILSATGDLKYQWNDDDPDHLGESRTWLIEGGRWRQIAGPPGGNPPAM